MLFSGRFAPFACFDFSYLRVEPERSLDLVQQHKSHDEPKSKSDVLGPRSQPAGGGPLRKKS